MPRIIVTTHLSVDPDDAAVLFDEEVQSVHLSTSHAAGQLVERIAWAIGDAEAVEDARTERHARPPLRPPRHPMHTHPGVSVPVGASGG